MSAVLKPQRTPVATVPFRSASLDALATAVTV